MKLRPPLSLLRSRSTYTCPSCLLKAAVAHRSVHNVRASGKGRLSYSTGAEPNPPAREPAQGGGVDGLSSLAKSSYSWQTEQEPGKEQQPDTQEPDAPLNGEDSKGESDRRAGPPADAEEEASGPSLWAHTPPTYNSEALHKNAVEHTQGTENEPGTASPAVAESDAVPESQPEEKLPDSSQPFTKSEVTPAKRRTKKAKVRVRKIRQPEKTMIEANPRLLKIVQTKRQAMVPQLAHSLDRVLFNPGVYHLQDPRSRVYNFDPYVETILPVSDFNFDALQSFVSSSKDQKLDQLARQRKRRYVGSSSSMTGVLSTFHFLLSNWRPLNSEMVSRSFPDNSLQFTRTVRGPAAVYLRWRDGLYALEADKTFDSDTVLSSLGHSMEKFLTRSPEEFEKFRKTVKTVDVAPTEDLPPPPPPEVEPNVYHYSQIGDFLIRSQLDAQDKRLPGSGVFDLKTRAVVTVRMDAKNYEEMRGYEIRGRFGQWESFEREYYDMIRSVFLKYSLQVRLGRMDGIFVAFHNTERFFGFQYIPLAEMDQAIHGVANPELGNREMVLSLQILNDVLNRATAKFPQQTLKLHFEARGGVAEPWMYIFAEPVSEETVQLENDTDKQHLKDVMTAPPEQEQEQTEPETESRHGAEQSESAEDTAEDTDRMAEASSGTPTQGQSLEGGIFQDIKSFFGVKSTPPSYSPDMPIDDSPAPLPASDLPAPTDSDSPAPTASDSPAPTASDAPAPTASDSPTPTASATNGEPESPLLLYRLTVKHEVDRKPVVRPADGPGEDFGRLRRGPRERPPRWRLTYQLRPAVNAAQAHRLYAACRERRRKLVGDEQRDMDYFLRKMRMLSYQGRRYRQGLARRARREGAAVVYGQ